MPKRLLRYALSRLDLLEAEALDMDNLELAIGRNTVFEFRDVGVKLKACPLLLLALGNPGSRIKLDKLLQLPAALQLSRAKVLLLRVTVPMDFYTSPITVDVDGVEVTIKVDSAEHDIPNIQPTSSSAVDAVPNTVDLAQSFLDTQPSLERKRLEDALVAETQDLAASVTTADDDGGSEDDSNALGTGQPLSLPVFLADFLQGIVDRTQVSINHVSFQLDMRVPTANGSTSPEPVSFQIALESIQVEGVTAAAATHHETTSPTDPPALMPKPGKRHISLAKMRAYIISETNVFSALTRSPSITSPHSAASSSPLLTRSAPSRQSSSLLSQGSFREQPMASLQESFRDRLSDSEQEEHPLGDSEAALAIPYDLEDQAPSTPRAQPSLYGSNIFPQEEAVFHPTVESPPFRETVHQREMRVSAPEIGHQRLPTTRHPDPTASSSARDRSEEDLAESHLYTHEEAESMYMSAFSSAERHSMASAASLALSGVRSRQEAVGEASTASTEDSAEDEEEGSPSTAVARSPRSVMPGAWGEESESSSGLASPTLRGNVSPSVFGTRTSARSPTQSKPDMSSLDTGAGDDLPERDDAPTPRGPSRVVKEIMRLDAVSIYVPSQHRGAPVPGSQPLPVQSLAMSTCSEAPAMERSSMGARCEDPSAQDENAIEVTLSPLTVDFDTSLALLLVMAVDNLLKAVKREGPVVSDKRPSKKDENKVPGIVVLAREISLNYVSHVKGVADTYGRHLNPSSFAFDQDEEVLLNATLRNLGIRVSPARIAASSSGDRAEQDAVIARIDLERFRFGYADGDMISFDPGRPMSTSVRDTFLTGGHDVGIKVIRSSTSTVVDVETLPLVVQLDLQRLDETLGWFGGLSSFLNMSASATTSMPGSPNVTTASSSPPPPAQTPTPTLLESRKSKPVVHFATPSIGGRGGGGQGIEQQHRPSTAVRNKINVRIGGALVELAGRECSVAAESNAVKMVGRDKGIGIACSHIRFSGPYMRNSGLPTRGHHDCHQTPPLSAEAGGLRLELSPVPEDRDLDKLLELIIPSKSKFDDGDDGEIMVDTLLRQRRKGSVLRITIETVNVRVGSPARLVPALPKLGEELAKLTTTVAAKYLPEDDRPGILTLVKLQKLSVSVNVGGRLGLLESQMDDFEVAQITVPSLVAVAIRGVSLRRNGTEHIISSESPSPASSSEERGPAVMARIIGDEMEPTVKLKLRHLRIEYRVPTIMDALGLDEELTTPHDFETSLAASVASLADQANQPLFIKSRQGSVAGQQHDMPRQEKDRPTALDIGLRDCLVGLNPVNLPSKLFVVLTDARVQAAIPPPSETTTTTTTTTVNINKASLLLIDDVAVAESMAAKSGGQRASARRHRRQSSSSSASPQVADLCARGFVDICYMSSASVVATVKPVYTDDGTATDSKQVDVELRDDLLVLETCADSTQTLIALANGLKPPMPPSKEDRYRTRVVPVQDLLASISAEAFGKPEGDYDFDQDFAGAQELAGSESTAGYGGNRLGSLADSRVYEESLVGEELFDATARSSSGEAMSQDTAEGFLLTGYASSCGEHLTDDSGDRLDIHEDFFAVDEGRGENHRAKLWNAIKNTYDGAPDALVRRSPLRLSVKDVHVIWNLFDGYDWSRTREVIAQAVEDVEAKATERQQQRLRQQTTMLGGLDAYEEQMEEEEETIGDFLFNSIYIGIPMNRDPRELTRDINAGLNQGDDGDTITETESVATTTASSTRTATLRQHVPGQQGRHGRRRRLRLNRSRRHKITFELRGVNADMIAYRSSSPESTARGGQETLSSIDVRVQTLDIFDHVPTSTWKKFVTYDQDKGEREMGTNMVHLELLNVRPIPDLAASEIVMRATVLPLRLHVDQDALDFITRFFEFKDERGGSAPTAAAAGGDTPFLQRAEVFDIPVKLDFKPKRVDYAGLRSGHTSEFMNFIVLEEARMVLRHVIVYGVSGFDRLGKTLNDIWTPDVRRNQLPGVVAGLAPVRSLVNIGSGFRDLVEIPLREYRKDGRVVRSISKGAAAFARTTGTELVKLGAKIAVGTQYALQGAEEMLLAERGEQHRIRDGDGGDDDDRDAFDDDEDLGELEAEDQKQISLYADQPTGVLQGIRGGYRSLTRDVNLARDAIIAVPGEVLESHSAGGAARAVLRRAPTIIFRPAVGVTKVIGQTLMGATNTIDPQNRRRIDEH
ncbi:hypothetical protein L249_1969 [Ophiocordyceps polyrhachis-furcata BCC 54312]|uniref:Autophagy-related protein 2 n=1 Tax=Ophiocordyceps polyrhachis-furcata BCC 54312 TaxID=1330021 RepID=A0A367LR39_9HYPO|nr:hypothetical protein L249_1969 [Ophiocordyceps polyrhachis-furcata BCC 54312]